MAGLPPSSESVRAFAAAPTREAYEREIDRLLATDFIAEGWSVKAMVRKRVLSRANPIG